MSSACEGFSNPDGRLRLHDSLMLGSVASIPVKYKVVLEYDPETRHHSVTVPGLPGLFVDAKSEREALKLAKEGIAFYLEELASSRSRGRTRAPKPSLAKIVTVEV